MITIKLYSANYCPYCKKLINLLKKDNIEFEIVDIETDKGDIEFNEVYKKIKTNLIPIVKLNNYYLIPEKSFKTINQCFEIIKKIIDNKVDLLKK